MNTIQLCVLCSYLISAVPLSAAGNHSINASAVAAAPTASRSGKRFKAPEAKAPKAQRAQGWKDLTHAVPVDEETLAAAIHASKQDPDSEARAAAIFVMGEWLKWSLEMMEHREQKRVELQENRIVWEDPEIALLTKAGLSDGASIDPTLVAPFMEKIGSLFNALTQSLQNERESNVRLETLKALAKTPRLAARKAPLLLATMGDKNPQVARLAEALVTHLPNPPASTLSQIAPFLQNGSYPIRYAALKLLKGMKGAASPALPDLLPLLKDKVEWMQESALDVVRSIGPGAKEAVPNVASLLSRNDRSVAVKKAALEALAAIGPAAAMEALSVASYLEKPETAASALRALGRIAPGDPKTSKAVNRMVDDEDIEVRFAAIDALASMLRAGIASNLVGLKTQRAQLLNLATNDVSPALRAKAVDSLALLVSEFPTHKDLADYEILGKDAVARFEFENGRANKPGSSAETIALLALSLENAESATRETLLKKTLDVFQKTPGAYSVPFAQLMKRWATSGSLKERALAKEMQLPITDEELAATLVDRIKRTPEFREVMETTRTVHKNLAAETVLQLEANLRKRNELSNAYFSALQRFLHNREPENEAALKAAIDNQVGASNEYRKLTEGIVKQQGFQIASDKFVIPVVSGVAEAWQPKGVYQGKIIGVKDGKYYQFISSRETLEVKAVDEKGEPRGEYLVSPPGFPSVLTRASIRFDPSTGEPVAHVSVQEPDGSWYGAPLRAQLDKYFRDHPSTRRLQKTLSPEKLHDLSDLTFD